LRSARQFKAQEAIPPALCVRAHLHIQAKTFGETTHSRQKYAKIPATSMHAAGEKATNNKGMKVYKICDTVQKDNNRTLEA
jgi:hypothetical protein